MLEYKLDAETAAQIKAPLLITSPENEQFWPGQSEKLAELTPDVSEVVEFTEAEGADGHCQPMARTLTHERVLDWLDRQARALASRRDRQPFHELSGDRRSTRRRSARDRR